jgi:glutamate synthase domain-containing protein 3
LIEDHLFETGSVKAADILRFWDEEKANFVQVCPKEMLAHLIEPLSEKVSAKMA